MICLLAVVVGIVLVKVNGKNLAFTYMCQFLFIYCCCIYFLLFYFYINTQCVILKKIIIYYKTNEAFMIFVFIPILLFLVLYKIKSKKIDSNSFECLDKKQTSSINGIFVLIVFFAHFISYIPNPTKLDSCFIAIPLFGSQLIVVPFLFYSGYGLMESFKSKGIEYIKSIPTRRFLKLFIDFAIAITSFLIVQTIIGTYFPFSQILLSYTAWKSIGNSNWYIFATFCFYFIIFVSFMTFKNNKYFALLFTNLLSIFYIVILYFVFNNTNHYFYNTFMCLPFGMWFSLYKEKIVKFLSNKYTYLIVLILLLVSIILLYKLFYNNPFVFNFISILFALTIFLFTMKFQIQNKFLLLLGKYTFWIFILQRIPMIVFKKIGIANFNIFVYFVITFVVTLLLAYAYNWLSEKISKIIWNRPKK